MANRQIKPLWTDKKQLHGYGPFWPLLLQSPSSADTVQMWKHDFMLSNTRLRCDQCSSNTSAICLCVCVNHLHRCKTSLVFDLNFTIICRGKWPTHEPIANEAAHELGGYWDWSSRRTCTDVGFTCFSRNGTWLTLGPPCRLKTTLNFITPLFLHFFCNPNLPPGALTWPFQPTFWTSMRISVKYPVHPFQVRYIPLHN